MCKGKCMWVEARERKFYAMYVLCLRKEQNIKIAYFSLFILFDYVLTVSRNTFTGDKSETGTRTLTRQGGFVPSPRGKLSLTAGAGEIPKPPRKEKQKQEKIRLEKSF